jgi:cytochrome c553
MMKSLLKWTGIVAASLVGLLALAVAFVFIASEVMLDRTYPKRPSTVHAYVTAETIARGAHLVVVATCTDCHTKDLTGQRFDVPGSTLYAPNLTALTRSFSDADYDRAIRQGIRPDGKGVLFMPSHIFANLTDDEVDSIIAYLRSLKPKGTASPDHRLGLFMRALLVTGEIKTEAKEFADAQPSLDMGPRYKQGRHLASMICAGCHGTNLAGTPQGSFLPTPDLIMVAAYDRGDFHKLMRTGKAAGGREVGVMSQTARRNFSTFTDAEIDSIYDYLAARGTALTTNQNTPSRQ